jgi:hypothetical protein
MGVWSLKQQPFNNAMPMAAFGVYKPFSPLAQMKRAQAALKQIAI